jgi:hypothetical protein
MFKFELSLPTKGKIVPGFTKQNMTAFASGLSATVSASD